MQAGKKMVSREDFEIERRSQPIARLEIYSPLGKPPTRAEITSALNRVIEGRFTLSLQSVRGDRVYVVEIVPLDALTWFAKNCDSFQQTGSAQVHWEELKRHLMR